MNRNEDLYERPIRPLAAWHAIRNLRKNPQDTQQVFILTQALRGSSVERLVQRFREDERGRDLLVRRPNLLSVLTRHDYLGSLPEGSLGRAYLEFVRSESLSAQGLADLSLKSGAYRPSSTSDRVWIASRLRDMHDVLHVLSGYGRDELGEISVLAFSYPHQRTRSFLVLAVAGAWTLARALHSWRVVSVIWQAWRNGCKARWLAVQDLESFLAQDLNALRAQLNIAPPTRYQAFIAHARNRGQLRSSAFMPDSSQEQLGG